MGTWASWMVPHLVQRSVQCSKPEPPGTIRCKF
jgi:hypothetical protein